MNVDINLNNIIDPYVLSNLKHIKDFLDKAIILNAEWRLLEIAFDGAKTEAKYAHNLGFEPKDVILLSVREDGTGTVSFHYDQFESYFIVLSVDGACTIRVLVGTIET